MEATFWRLGSGRKEDTKSLKLYIYNCLSYWLSLQEANSDRGYYDISVFCTYKLKWKPLFDGKARLDLQSHYRGALPGKPLCPSVPKMGTDGQTCPSVPKLGTDGHPAWQVRAGQHAAPDNCILSLSAQSYVNMPIYDLHSRQLTVESWQ